MKKVLIIAYYWPPAGGPGVQRWLKFVKYLPEFGIDPIVYVPENPSYPIVDESLITEVPKDITVIKQPINEPYKLAQKFSKSSTKSISKGIIPNTKTQSLKDKFMNWLNPRYHIIMNNAETDEVDIIETKSFYIREGNHFKNIRFLTRSEDDGSIEEDDNSDLSVGCHELQYKGGAFTVSLIFSSLITS